MGGSEVEPLHQIGAGLPEVGSLRFSLDTFADDGDVQVGCQRQDGSDHGAGAWVAGQFGDQAAVDFDEGDGQLYQAGQRGVAGAEVVDGQRVTGSLQGG